jgi:hypothetical protein
MNPQMRMLILLAVLWGAGSLLLAAESPSTPRPAAADKPAAEKPAAEKPAAEKPGTVAQPEADANKAAQGASKTDTEPGKGSIAEQAEAALKAAAEADPAGAPSEPPKGDDDAEAKDGTQPPPATSAARAPSPQRFVPSEQVRADFDVSFPIDI